MTTETCRMTDAFTILDSAHKVLREQATQLETLGRVIGQDGLLGDARLARMCRIIATLDTLVPIHTEDEEASLFPAVIERLHVAEGETTPMELLTHEHGFHERLMLVLKRSIARADPAAISEAAVQLAQQTREHVDKEDGLLFPFARAALAADPETLDAITATMAARHDAAGLPY